MGVGVALGRPKGPILVEMIGRVVPARCRSLLFAFSQPQRDIRSGSGNSEGRRWLVEGRVGGVRAG